MMGYVTFLQIHTESGKKYFSYCIKLQRLRTQMCKVILNPYNQSTKQAENGLQSRSSEKWQDSSVAWIEIAVILNWR